MSTAVTEWCPTHSTQAVGVSFAESAHPSPEPDRVHLRRDAEMRKFLRPASKALDTKRILFVVS